ncbi:hypothetical protein ORI20_22950 [Mycobacterium sp. CVI_P3]|uniref:Uncharacterized protein n=1 Tax=Mycobacterium pinniadriaticum TaxID=2994102 RepID=A0ABT3SJM2_9MYCO|nr:hypothetical protein [Mycobacterium pinniadriaticum]MCX2933133.1 hypothetical protein [Mycobacterium pinniadriaticum]MCX2939567.1 hypothetical protein [Mycobacterium pinniadriaticum]
MTDPTSDEDDHADYTDAHKELRRADRLGSGPERGEDIRDLAPDVADLPGDEPPD